jgi:hypothetical protein
LIVSYRNYQFFEKLIAKAKKRRFIAKEILSTELVYVDSLNTVVNVSVIEISFFSFFKEIFGGYEE